MKRKILAAALLLLLLFSGTSLAQGDIRLWIYGDYIESDVAPYIKNDRTMVPLRVISEELDKDVIWVPEYRSVVIGNTYNDFEDAVIFRIGDRNLYHADGYIMAKLDAPPEIRGDRTFVPLRAVAEALQMEIGWDGAHRTVYIGPDYRPPKYDRRQMHLRIEGKDYPIPVQYQGEELYGELTAVADAFGYRLTYETAPYGGEGTAGYLTQPNGRKILTWYSVRVDGIDFSNNPETRSLIKLHGRDFISMSILADALHMYYAEDSEAGIITLTPDTRNEEYPIIFHDPADTSSDYVKTPASSIKIRYQNGRYELIGMEEYGVHTIKEFQNSFYFDESGNFTLDKMNKFKGEARLLFDHNYYLLSRNEGYVFSNASG